MRISLAALAGALLLYALFVPVPHPPSSSTSGANENGAAVQSQLSVPGAAQGNGQTAPPSGRSVIVRLNPVAKSGETGFVTVREISANKTSVEINLLGAPRNETLPAGIYAGTCASQAAEVQYALNPVVQGHSSTTLNVSFQAIIGGAAQALKVKQSSSDTSRPYAACAELR